MQTIQQDVLVGEIPQNWRTEGQDAPPNRFRELWTLLHKYKFTQHDLLFFKQEIDWHYAIKENKAFDRRKEKERLKELKKRR